MSDDQQSPSPPLEPVQLVTELAILPLKTAQAPFSRELYDKLLTAQPVLSFWSATPFNSFHIFQQVEDASLLYILGTWWSVEHHKTFLRTTHNRELLESLKDDVDLEKIVMYHLDENIFRWEEGKEPVLKAETISLNRHFVPASKKDGFREKFNEVKGLLEEYTSPFRVVGGWRIEKESEEKEEW
jgi:heme-degrading monooxygenase HmoA